MPRDTNGDVPCIERIYIYIYIQMHNIHIYILSNGHVTACRQLDLCHESFVNQIFPLVKALNPTISGLDCGMIQFLLFLVL